MQGQNELQLWRQRHEELLREAEMTRLARVAGSNKKRRARLLPALGWELQRCGGRISKLFRALRHAI